MDDLTNEDVTDILALLDSLPYDELDVQTPRFRLLLRRTPDGWTQSMQTRPAAPAATTSLPQRGRQDDMVATTTRLDLGAGEAVEANGAGEGDGSGEGLGGTGDAGLAGDAGLGGTGGAGLGGTGGAGLGGTGDAGLVPGMVTVRAPLPGTFYRAPRPGAAPFVEVGDRVTADSVVGIVETMKLMNSVTAGAAGTVAEICLGNAEFAANGATLLRIRAD